MRLQRSGPVVFAAIGLAWATNAVLAQSLPLLTPMTPAATLALISENGDTPTSIEFVNDYSGAVTVNWIDYSGTIEFYMTLSPGQSYVQPTFVTHPWIIYDANTGVALEGFLPIAQAAEALITNPGAEVVFQTTSL